MLFFIYNFDNYNLLPMTHYNFNTRTQPLNRSHLGSLPNSKETKNRLTEIKETNKSIESLKIEAKIKSGDEFFFAMNSCYKKDGKIIRKTEPNIKDANKNLKLLNHEIQVIKNKIKQFITKPTGKHVRFEECNKNEKVELKFEDKLCNYLDELIRKREEMVEFLRGNKKVNIYKNNKG